MVHVKKQSRVLQKIFRCFAQLVGFAPERRRIKLKKGCLMRVFVHFHHGRLIATAVAIIGGRKDSDQGFFVAPTVSFHDQLMSPDHRGQAVAVRKGLRHVGAKPSHTWLLREGLLGSDPILARDRVYRATATSRRGEKRYWIQSRRTMASNQTNR